MLPTCIYLPHRYQYSSNLHIRSITYTTDSTTSNMSKTIQLHCPSLKRTVDGYVITPFQSADQILQGTRLALSISHASLYNTDAKPLTKLDTIQDDQRILVAASPKEVMLPDSLAEFEFYDGQELDGEEEWEWLSEREKCDHVIGLNEKEPWTRNKLRMTRGWEAVDEDLRAIKEADEEEVDAKEAESMIEQRWRTNIEHFLPGGMKPAKLKKDGKFWNEKVVAALKVFSSFTLGQARLAAEFLQEAVQLRIGDEVDTSPIVQFQDIVNAITIIYERAGIIKENLTKPKSAKAREKGRKKALREKAKKGKGAGAGQTE
jgi:hypothetical protein